MEGSSGSTANDSSTRKQNLLKRHKINEGEGTLSKLPEPLVSHILSFLPTKDAVRTSVLSKKWQFRWTFITKLDLDDTVFYKRKSGGKMYFVNFVYRALLLTKSSSLESFSLVIANKYDVFLLNTWICNILIRDIKNLCIVTQSEMSFSAHASHSLFNSRLLEELVLKTMHSFAIRVTESVVQFEHLKLLKLSGILFSLDFNSKHLTLSLPVLKVFETLNCTWLNAKRITLKVPLLESVIITQDTKPPSYVKPHCAFEFSASHLKEFSYCGCGYISHYFKLLDTSSAHNASLNITVNQCPINRDPETEVRAFLLLKQFSQVKYLKFEGCQVLAQSKVASLPLFGMLSELELGLVSGEVLLGLLLKSPVLKTLLFEGISNFDKELLNSAAVPECLTSTLQVVKFHKLHGCEHELCLAKFVMENGLVLERMSFFLASHCLGKSKIMEEFKAKLFSFKKGFSFAIVEFSYDD
ncbi:hypothetical protein AAZX31_17G184400 [Glycine max]|uniref:F-box/FBD/LRR-repeat protein n=2 Tax=Glycine soja TaxID=3848 RepID=A0A445G8X5_GLYSO|nr:F-box/FBD/LRR-repeat protein At3g14710-like [Glycine soja]KAG4931078.1 hypothetical protein JHK86_048039 [Glycine max]KAG4933832.1 hypothetical protein JHK87_047834 [Glycine soja]KAG4944013.1 hypothetical protein JHK85_048659 [Glycine max]KAG5103102.1 hypothetical protein JHK84_048071 [Glycine max]KAH1203401.1 F-box/FBD/LRR-repeat protein [Glycine max]|eukprot:XP_006601071.1 F-box/FBD/LRR-repeat protein At3g14710 [Glycine max]